MGSGDEGEVASLDELRQRLADAGTPTALEQDAIEALEHTKEQLERCNEVAQRRHERLSVVEPRNALLESKVEQLRAALFEEFVDLAQNGEPSHCHLCDSDVFGLSHDEDCLLHGYEPEEGDS